MAYLIALYPIERGIPTRRAFFGEGRGPVHLSRAECTSDDADLLDCTIDKSAVNGCDHSEDAGVICRGTCTCDNFIIFKFIIMTCVCMHINACTYIAAVYMCVYKYVLLSSQDHLGK